MDTRCSDHAYHRSRVDAHIAGSVILILFMGGMAFLVGDKFQPFVDGSEMWRPTVLAWHAEANAWIPAVDMARELDAPVGSATGKGQLCITKEIYPQSYSLVLGLSGLIASLFLYLAARRQTRLMLASLERNAPDRPYDRTWEEIRVTFWALFLVLLGVLFVFFVL
jgi:hypothetical protein